MTALLAGLGLGLSLIVAIGAQNLFVLRQGARREHVFLVATLCVVSDLILIAVGVAGIGAATRAVPWLVTAVRWAGAAFLIGYGVLAARRAIRPGTAGAPLLSDAGADDRPRAASGVHEHDLGAAAISATEVTAPPVQQRGAGAVALTCLALTWLNPHVYLDTVFLLGSVAATHGADRWLFAAGAGLGSITWFYALAYGAGVVSRRLTTPLAARALDGFVAIVMTVLGISLLVSA